MVIQAMRSLTSYSTSSYGGARRTAVKYVCAIGVVQEGSGGGVGER